MLALNFGESDCFLRFLREASGPVDPLLGAGLFTLPFNGACNAAIFCGFIGYPQLWIRLFVTQRRFPLVKQRVSLNRGEVGNG